MMMFALLARSQRLAVFESAPNLCFQLRFYQPFIADCNILVFRKIFCEVSNLKVLNFSAFRRSGGE